MLPAIWSLDTAAVFTTLQSSPQGLSTQEAQERLRQNGPNELPEPPRRHLWLRFLDQLTHFMALLLWVAGILAFVSGTPELGWAIWAVIWINALFSFSQEFQAERAMAALKNVLPAQSKVYRDGNLIVIPARELVPGDLMELEEGDRISADARLISAQALSVDTAILTGESLPVARQADPIPVSETGPPSKVQPAELANLIFAGSTVAAGRAQAVVYATANRTEFGHVVHLTTSVQREPSTLEVQITKIVRFITGLALSMGALVFLLTQFIVGMELQASFIFAIGIIVAFVPEGLLPTVTLSLAIAVQRMARRNALVRRLSAVEALSATTVICTDKTGTLTQNEMTVRSLWIPTTLSAASGDQRQVPNDFIEVSGVGYAPIGTVAIPDNAAAQLQVQLLLAGGALCSNARLVQQPTDASQPLSWQEVGDPTEAALLVVALKAGLPLDAFRQRCPRLREIPFDSSRRMMTVVLDWQQPELWANSAPFLSLTKGAPLDVLARCQWVLQAGEVLPLTDTARSVITAANDQGAEQGYRVLAIAVRKGGQELLSERPEQLEQELIFLGLTAMMDPPRVEVAEAIAHCHKAGISVTMVTGDYGKTAAAIAAQIGLTDGHPRVVTGNDLTHLSDAQLRQILHRWRGLIFARVMPEQKLRIVQAYKSLGQVVAVTGDGVNDAPALQAANIGIAMGRSGTDVAREAADIVLLDDNFATIVSAIEQGRGVYQNIRKFMTYILASNVAEVVPFLLMVILKIPPALVVLQILAIDLGTDMIPALALGAEQPERGTMAQPPRDKNQSLLDRALLMRAYGFLGPIESIAGMTVFFVVWGQYGYGLMELQAIAPSILDHTATPSVLEIYRQATTLTLTAIVASQDGNVFSCRSEWLSIFRLGFLSNPWILVGIATEWALILAIIYVVPLQTIFGTAPLGAKEWLMLLMWPFLLLGLEELRKVYGRRQGKRLP
jgi:Ca2+-transporting ATPase